MKWIKHLFSRRRRFDELSSEIRAHLAERTQDLVVSGVSRRDAEAMARREFGNVAVIEEQGRSVWGWVAIENLLTDLRFGLRALRKNPGFTIVAMVTLALGIGANAALFSVIDAVLLRPLAFRDPGRLVALRTPDLQDPNRGGEISYPAFLDWRAQAHSFEGMSAWNARSFTYTGGEQAESVDSAEVSANLFSLLGVQPLVGRSFVDGEDQPGASSLPTVLSYEFWQSHFGGDANVIGRTMTLDAQKYDVVGVMPAGFQFPIRSSHVELWTTIAGDLRPTGMATQRGVSYLFVIARLKAGVQIPQASAELKLVQDQLNRQYPENRPHGTTIRSESDEISGDMRPALFLLLGAVGFVLLIACANVASLLLARATARRTEFALRAALGASRWMIARQLLTESVVLAMAGGILGLIAARWAIGGLLAIVPPGLGLTSEISIDLRVLAFCFVVSVATGVLFGLAPAMQMSLSRAAEAQREGGRGSSRGVPGTKLRQSLVAAQVAIAFVLLIGAGLLMRSFEHLRQVRLGFRADHLLTFLLDVPPDHHPRAQRAAFVRELLQSARELPGVISASAIFGLPLDQDRSAFTVLEIEGKPLPPAQRPRVAFRIIESTYFNCMGIRLLHGRTFTARDEQGGPQLVVVNETLARQNFPNENPVGRRIRPSISFGPGNDAPVREIVGVVSDVRSGSVAGEAVPEVYVPQTPNDFVGEMTIVVRTQADPNFIVPAMRSLVASMDKELPLRDVKPMEQYVTGAIAQPRFEAVLLGTFAAVAFALTAMGLYGVISYMVALRTREVGIRIALGAQRTSISRMVVREGVGLALAGVACGLFVSVLTLPLLRGLLYGVALADPATFLAVPILLVIVALLASYVPAGRAMRVDPMVALREE
jgi:putative ABC transport system permease protein